MAKGVIISAEERAKVIEEKANNPFMSAQQIADKLGLTERTVSRIVKEEMASVGEKSKVIAHIIEENKLKDVKKVEVCPLGLEW